ncbi:MAG: S-ribosylhomocysteine lyase [Succinivibrionaceae bacterium]|nr:S-ribosylhomocysteine lyase [Succinivibrionaceae bacterium]
MPIIQNFAADHTKMKAPAVRISRKFNTKGGDVITVYDLRFCQPNAAVMDQNGMHTLDHLLPGFMRQHLNSDSCEIVSIAPIGSRTGFYMTVIGEPDEQTVADAWRSALYSIIAVKSETEIPGLNRYQCGACKEHSLSEAQNIAKAVLSVGISVNYNDDLKLDETLIKN